jgi:uncharacterized membrane protein YfcA
MKLAGTVWIAAPTVLSQYQPAEQAFRVIGGDQHGGRMHVDPYIVLGSAVVGLLVGLTGAGGGALMTPMLILLFGIKPSTAISSDLVAAVIMRPFGAAVHIRKGTVNFRLVGWLVCGSVPMAFVGAYLLHLLGNGSAAQSLNAQDRVETVLGAALLIGAAAMVLRYVLDWRSGQQRLAKVSEITARPGLTIAIGAIGGLIVGMTSVGSGSLMIVLMLFLYPMLSAGQLVGTDLTQAVPLTLAAACGALLFGHVQFPVTASIVIGSIPAVLVGSFLSSRAPDKVIRPIITFVIFASGLKYAGVGTTALGWILVIVLLGGALTWLAVARPWRNASVASSAGKDSAVLASATTSQQLSNSLGGPDGRAPSTPSPPGLAEDRVVPVNGLEAADSDHVGEHG